MQLGNFFKRHFKLRAEKKKSPTKSAKIAKKKDPGNFPISQMIFAERKLEKLKFSQKVGYLK